LELDGGKWSTSLFICFTLGKKALMLMG